MSWLAGRVWLSVSTSPLRYAEFYEMASDPRFAFATTTSARDGQGRGGGQPSCARARWRLPARFRASAHVVTSGIMLSHSVGFPSANISSRRLFGPRSQQLGDSSLQNRRSHALDMSDTPESGVAFRRSAPRKLPCRSDLSARSPRPIWSEMIRHATGVEACHFL